jgi:choline kinase
MSVKLPTSPSTPLLPPTLRSYSSFESFHSLSLDKDPTPDEEDILVKEEGLRHAETFLNAK